MKIEFRKQNIPFTQVANGVLYDKKLSLGAKTVYAFMYSKPDGWEFSAERIGNELSASKTKILNHLDELRTFGYLISQRLPSGRMLYKVVYPPVNPQSKNLTMANKPQSKKAMVQKSHGAETGPVSNKDTISNKEEESNTNLVADRDEGIFNFEEELNKLKNSPRKDMKIIALYWKKKLWTFENREQFTPALRRELRAAQTLKGYSGEQIAKSINYCIKKYPEAWSLETVFKRIQDLTNKNP